MEGGGGKGGLGFGDGSKDTNPLALQVLMGNKEHSGLGGKMGNIFWECHRLRLLIWP